MDVLMSQSVTRYIVTRNQSVTRYYKTILKYQILYLKMREFIHFIIIQSKYYKRMPIMLNYNLSYILQ